MVSSSTKHNLLFYFFFFEFLNKFSTNFLLNFNFYFFFKIKLITRSYFFSQFKLKKIKTILKKEPFSSSLSYNEMLLKKDKINSIFNQKDLKPHGFHFHFFINQKEKFYYKLLNFFFLNSFLPHLFFFKKTGFLNFFYFKNSTGTPFILNLNKVMNRWMDFFNLILNTYLFDLKPLIYSSPFFKNETLALNWNMRVWDLQSWKLTFPFFIFKVNYFSVNTKHFYEKMKDAGFDFFIVTDCIYHFKNLYFFKKFFFRVIGLISLNLNPWIVYYPVLASTNSYFNQIFFLQSLVFSQKKAFFLKFLYFKKIWTQSLLNL